ncbi:RNA polymerase factor sigma-54 [Ornithinibacillus sp. L9]|uniref:RNA polymerase factor sigma-54 n=1 Tax=Ornithinibacillus caprae TaxID=2678566 RepID=A0A6N8FIW7_9BACI|nr:RNA polymerase factor sigma-54 [Ornithinibacillus caprae]MUK89181.1 RNA polymerase factor sigma-54 [Ornithinibacillus caprae]
MRQKIVHEQILQQKMSKSLIQAIHLLQFSSVELLDYIQEISKDNPLIEEVNFDYELTRYKNVHSDPIPFEELNERKLSFYDQLKEQLYTLKLPAQLKPVVLFGIDSLDETGYLEIGMEEWSEKCDASIKQVEKALTFIQSLEPAGIGARTLSECILLQLKNMKSYQLHMEDLLENHLVWVAEEDVSAITEYYGITEEEALQTIHAIQACHPKPGQLLVEKEPEYIIPEASIKKENGEWKISFYKWSNPTIRVSESYKQLRDLGKEGEAYLKEKNNQIDWLHQVLSYRVNTIEQVIKKIVEKQAAFFERGYYMLQPLTLQELANELHVHVSTVSRAIRSKYVQTQYGIIPLKFFLQPGIKQQSGKPIAAFVVKKLIHELIEHEEKLKPLSDEAIRMRLRDEFGIQIARRTVMKYREQLGIPSSIKRK